MKSENESQELVRKLNSRGPAEKYRDKLMLFGQFVGDWDIVECRSLLDDGTWETTREELHWGWILDGRAVQDIWMTTDPETWENGTTVRFYDSRIDAWQSVWISPGQEVVRKFIGRQIGNEIVLETTELQGKLMHWIFFDIARDSFKWRAVTSTDGGKTWVKIEEMRIVRKKP